MRTKEEIDLLLHDLCARAPYGVICKGEYLEDGTYETRGQSHYEEVEGVIEEIYNFNDEEEPPYIVIEGQSCDPFGVKPYLRKITSLTEEEAKHIPMTPDGRRINRCHWPQIVDHDYLNSIHVDYRGLIEKGLAIEVTEENNPYKK